MRRPPNAIRSLVRPVVGLLRGICYAALDWADRWRGRADDLTPPRSLQAFVGRDAAFEQVGNEFVAHFRNLCQLQPAERILDIGCGAGRMAIPLLGYLDSQGRYTGFDIARKAIRWCSTHITGKNARFVFHWADIFNRQYNPGGKGCAARYRFPCEDGSIDFVFATSVFTHMFPDDVRHYLREIQRVLAGGGRGLLTFFILDQGGADRPGTGLVFNVHLGDCYTIDARIPESAIAFAEAKLRAMVAEAGLAIEEPIRAGRWSGHRDGLSYQDILIVSKPA